MSGSFRRGRCARGIRYFNIFEVVLADFAQGVAIDPSSEQNQTQTRNGVLEEIWSPRADEGLALPMPTVVVCGLSACHLNDFPRISVARVQERDL